jgi:hypothetical protein
VPIPPTVMELVTIEVQLIMGEEKRKVECRG